MRFNLLVTIFMLIPSLAFAGSLHPEKTYADAWCEASKGEREHLLRDRTRVDCLTKNYATEVEFARRWSQSIGQALHYARLTGEKPAVVLIIEKDSDWDYYWKLMRIAKGKGVKVWYMRPEDLASPGKEAKTADANQPGAVSTNPSSGKQ